jgi:aconitate hydratase
VKPHTSAASLIKSFPHGKLVSLPALSKQFPSINRLPHSLRLVLESVARNVDGERITMEHVAQLANWKPRTKRSTEIPFVVARVVLQDLTGVPLLADLAAMRSSAQAMGHDPSNIEPLVPVDMVVDHSVMIDHYGSDNALDLNMRLEFSRNKERYEFLKWGMQAFSSFSVVPPGIGIVHQVNLEYLARGIHTRDGLSFPDTLVGTDSHTTMINGVGVVGWGVGGIEAEAGMLGQPIYFLTPDVVGVHLHGRLREGCTATDLVLTITQLLRGKKVVGKFVEFFGAGTQALSVPDRATIANMAPEYGATMGFFSVDETTIDFFKGTGRTEAEVAAFSSYFKAQNMFGTPSLGSIDYSEVVELDLATITPSLAGPKRPQDRIELGNLAAQFAKQLEAGDADDGFALTPTQASQRVTSSDGISLKNGDVLLAAITSCTNTSNPSVMLAAGLLAQKAVARGLKVPPHIKTSLAPGSRVVTDYLTRAGLIAPLSALGFNVTAYGCTSCIGNAGDLSAGTNQAIIEHKLVCAAVLSGNRNFEARIHPNLRANFLASPPLVIAYAIAGNMQIDLMTEPLGHDQDGNAVYLGDVWPSSQEIAKHMHHALNPDTFRRLYSNLTKDHKLWNAIKGATGPTYGWPASSYIARPPFLDDFQAEPMPLEHISNARVLALFGDSITTDHISPAGSIKPSSAAGKYLLAQGIKEADFNSYGARRGHHEVMMRGTFANVRIRNQMLPKLADGSTQEGGITLHQPSGEPMFIYDAAMRYMKERVPTVVFAGQEYGTGSSRDWAAKGTKLLGVRAVIARSFERIHRSNLVGMGVLPLQFHAGQSWSTLGLSGNETIDLPLPGTLKAQQDLRMTITRADGTQFVLMLLLRIDTAIEVEYFKHGGILPYVLRHLTSATPRK